MHSAPTHFAAQVERLHPSPLNPRKTIGDLADLTASVKSKGVLQSLLVRPLQLAGVQADGGLEIVCGERRWRAAKAAGLASVPVILREDLDDAAALEAMVIENSQRADVHPLEEADGIAALRERGQSVEEIAAKLGRPPAFVYRRLVLCELGDKARKLFFAGDMTVGAAEVLATVPRGKLQDQALDECTRWGERPFGRLRFLQTVRTFRLDLASARWKLDDADLLPKAGACSSCPKRSGAQPALFEEEGKAEDRCLDPECFYAKTDAVGKQLVAAAKAEGRTVLGKAEAKQLWPHKHSTRIDSKDYVALDEASGYYGDGKRWRAVLGKKRMPKEVAIAVNPFSGAVVELVKRSDVKRALKEDPKASDPSLDKPSRGPGSTVHNAAEKKRRAEEKARAKARLSIVEKLSETLRAKKKYSAAELEAWLTLIVEAVVDQCRSYDGKRDAELLRRRGVEVEKETVRDVGEQLMAWARGASTVELVALAMEMLVRRGLDDLGELDEGEPLYAQRVLEHAGVPWLEIEQAALEEAREKLAKKKAMKKAGKKTSKKKAKRTLAEDLEEYEAAARAELGE